jgi:hypothetical protein
VTEESLTESSTKHAGLKRILIAFLAIGVIGAAAFAGSGQSTRVALAQQLTPTETPTPTQTPTITPTGTFTVTSTWTPTFTPTWTPTGTLTPTGFETSTPTPTWTPFGFTSPLVTPTPTREVRIVTEISHPGSGDAVAGAAEILGTALMAGYRKYEIHISPAGAETWSWLITSLDVVHDGTLFVLDSTLFGDGFYDLRLRTIDDLGNYQEAFLRGLEVRNANPPTPTPAFDALGTPLPPQPLSPLGSPTPTPRPRIVQNIPNGQGIFAPEVGQRVFGPVDIVGTANGNYLNPFVRYEIAISPATEGNWTWLYSGETQMWQGVLYTLDSTRFADGSYDIRLRNVYRDGNYDEFILRYLQIDNAGVGGSLEITGPTVNGFTQPASNSSVRGITQFVVTATDPAFSRWELAWSPAGLEEWAALTAGDRQARNETIARLDLSKLAGTQIDVRLRVVRQDGNYDDYFVRGLRVQG